MKVVACIQARMGSKRLRGKVMKKIMGKTLVQIEFERLRSCKGVDQVVLATSTAKENNVLVKHVKKIGLSVYRGSEYDLVSRLGKTAEKFGADALVRVTADNPLVDARILASMIRIWRKNAKSVDLVTNTFPKSFPRGLDLEIISSKVFPKLNKEIWDDKYREIFTVFIMNNSDKFKIKNYSNRRDLSTLRWTVDYMEDLKFVRAVFEKFKDKGTNFYMQDILSLLKKDPKIEEINKKWIGG